MFFAFDLPAPITFSSEPTVVENTTLPLLAKNAPPIPTGTMAPPNSLWPTNFRPKKRSKITSKIIPISPIKSMTLPSPGWWQYYPSIIGGADGYIYEFSPKGDKDTTICISYDGIEDAPYIAEIFKKPPHQLSKVEMEKTFGKESRMKQCQTLDWNGKKVLLFSGSETKVIESGKKNVRYYNLLYDGHVGFYSFIPVVISFTAVPAKYNKYINVVKASFKTIAWEPEVEKPKEEIFYREGPNGELIPVKTEKQKETTKDAPSGTEKGNEETR